jgi:hypothetical protein
MEKYREEEANKLKQERHQPDYQERYLPFQQDQLEQERHQQEKEKS